MEEAEQTFKSKKKQLELAIWQKNVNSIRDVKESIEDLLKDDQLSEELQSQANLLVKKANDTITALQPADSDLEASGAKEKNLSIRSKARQSHMKFMNPKKDLPLTKPKLSNMFQDQQDETSKREYSKRGSIHRSMTLLEHELPDPLRQSLETSDEIVTKEELEGKIVSLCLAKLKGPLSSKTARMIHRIFQKIQNGDVEGGETIKNDSLDDLKKTIEDLEIKGELDVPNSTPIISVSPPSSISENNNSPKPEITIKSLRLTISQNFEPENAEDSWKYLVHWCTSQGKRNTIEDRVTFFPFVNELLGLDSMFPSIFYVALCDGHNGDMAAEYSNDYLLFNIVRSIPFSRHDYREAIHEGFLVTDQNFSKKAKRGKTPDHSGSTATILMIIGEKLYCANVGDSKAVLYQGVEKGATVITEDHVAADLPERERIKTAGGIVVWYSGSWRVNGVMMVSRSIGDTTMENLLIAEPHIYEKTLESDDEFIIVASDGLWDVCSPTQACEFVRDWYREWSLKGRLSDSAADLGITINASTALANWALNEQSSKDNVTISVLFLKEHGTGSRLDKADSVDM